MRRAGYIVEATLRQILGVKRFLMFGALVLMPSLLLLVQGGDSRPRNLLIEFVDVGTGSFFQIALPITALILSASALGSERSDHTLSFLVLRPIPRWSIAVAKLGAAFLGALTINAGGALVLVVIYGVRASDWAYVIPILAGTAVATLIYTAIFVPLGYITERSTLIGLAFVFVWEAGIVGGINALGITSPWRLGYAAFVDLAPSEILSRVDEYALVNLTPDIGSTVIQVVVFLALSTAFLTWMLRSRDLA
jgi:ABC-2 type transport system permease protein